MSSAAKPELPLVDLHGCGRVASSIVLPIASPFVPPFSTPFVVIVASGGGATSAGHRSVTWPVKPRGGWPSGRSGGYSRVVSFCFLLCCVTSSCGCAVRNSLSTAFGGGCATPPTAPAMKAAVRGTTHEPSSGRPCLLATKPAGSPLRSTTAAMSARMSVGSLQPSSPSRSPSRKSADVSSASPRTSTPVTALAMALGGRGSGPSPVWTPT
mmetsp:Transcript_11414/g.38040  ORF Transcript_11414/g.38040 Transcript_11414/m.38040 type:complete len:211 (-) Transcript_11414:672-1304(-)